MSSGNAGRVQRLIGAVDQLRTRWIDRGTEAASLGFATRIRTFNRATLAMLLVVGVYFVALLANRTWSAVAALTPALVWLSVLPALLRRHYFASARALTVIVVNGTILTLALMYGRAPGVHLLFFAAVPFPLGIYEPPRERRAILFGLSLPMLAGLAFAISRDARTGADIDGWLYPVTMFTSFLLVLHQIWAFGREMHGLQELLLTVNQTIHSETTRREQLERRFENSRRVEALGELAAGLAHEINTPLQYVTDSLGFLDRSGQRLLSFTLAVEKIMPELDEQHRLQLEAVAKRIKLPRLRDEHLKAWLAAEEGLARVSELVVAMKALANPSGDRLASDINEILSNAAIVTRGTWAEVAELNLELAPELPQAEVVAGEFAQVFVHLIVNAADAIREKGGALPGKIWLRTRSRAGRIEVEVEDTGCGIAEEIQHRVFEPFFTTKEVGRGSGQGLSLTYTSILRHGGELTFESNKDVGTVFRISLPLPRTTTDATGVERPAPAPQLPGGSTP